MAELVYAFDLKSNGETRTGSSPVSATRYETEWNSVSIFLLNDKINSTHCRPATHRR